MNRQYAESSTVIKHNGVQLSIPTIEETVYETGMKLPERFEAFAKANPHVQTVIVSIARELKRLGFDRCSMKLIFEQMRWRYALQTRGDSYKLNNSFTAFYARRVMAEAPDLAGFFATRERR